MIDQNELANRYFWILEYITVDNLDPVSTVQTQLRKGSYRKKHGSRYDSHNEDLGLFAMLTPPISDPEPAVFYSPSTAVRTEALSPAEPSMESDSWRSNSNRTRHSPTKLARKGSFRGSGFGGKHNPRGLQRSQSLQTSSNVPSNVPPASSNSLEHSSVSPRFLHFRGSRRVLERWECEASCDRSLEEGIRALGSEGTAWDQFEVNRERFGVESGYNESLYTMPMSSLEMNEGEWREVVRIAEEMGEGEGEREGEEDRGEEGEEARLFSDVRCGKEEKEGEEDDFVDSAIRKKRAAI